MDRLSYKRRLLALLTASILLLGTATTAFADEIDGSSISEANDIMSSAHSCNWDGAFSFWTEAGNHTPLDASTFYKTYEKVATENESQLQYYTSANVDNVAFLNLQYESLVSEMKDSWTNSQGQTAQLTQNAGYSMGITEYFEQVYGDAISGKGEISASMPEGWSFSELMETASAKRNEVLKDAQERQEYMTVKNTIALEEALSNAKNALDTPEIKSTLELSAMLKTSTEAMEKEWDQKKQDGVKWVQDIAASNEGKVDAVSKEDMQTMYENSVGETKAWLELNSSNTDNLNVQEDMINKMKEYLQKSSSSSSGSATGTTDTSKNDEGSTSSGPPHSGYLGGA